MLESPWKRMVKRAAEPPHLERVELAIWDLRHSRGYSSPNPTIPDIIRASGFPSSTVYRCIERLERIGRVKRVKDEEGKVRVEPLGSLLMGSESERLIYDNLCSGDTKVASLALQELDQLSRKERIRSDNLLGYITSESRLKSALNFRILTRQAVLVKKDNNLPTLHKLSLRMGYAEKIALNTSENPELRDEAFLYLKVINPDIAVKVALKMIKMNKPDEPLDSTQPTQLWIDLSTTLAVAGLVQPTTRRQLYAIMREKLSIAAARAEKILKTALTIPQDTTATMFGNVPPKPSAKQQPQN